MTDRNELERLLAAATEGNRCDRHPPSASRYIGERPNCKIENAPCVRCQRYPDYLWRAPWDFCGEFQPKDQHHD